MDEPFIKLSSTWLATHPPGRQQDAAEYAGWLREQFLRHMPWDIIQKGWENRILDEVVDRGAIYAPILFRCLDQKTCQLQALIFFGTNRHLTQWHSYVHIPWYACRLNDSLT